jgi:RNAse (barnase) inhibitor barstar
LGITANNAEILRELIQKAAIEGEVIQEDTTDFGQQFKVDWTVPDTSGIELRTIWEVTTTNSNPRLISAFLKP